MALRARKRRKEWRVVRMRRDRGWRKRERSRGWGRRIAKKSQSHLLFSHTANIIFNPIISCNCNCMKYMSALRDALGSYIEAVEAMLLKCYAASDHGVESNDLSWDLAVSNLKDAHDSFHSALKEANEFHVQISKQPSMQQSKAVAPNAAKLACLSLNDAPLRDQSVLPVKDQIDSEDILENNHGDQADMSEEDMMVLSLASADLDVFMAELEEILEYNHDLSDLDSNSKERKLELVRIL